MNISASETAADSDRLGRTLELYRDLSVALLGRIAKLKADTVGEEIADAKTERLLEGHRKALQTVFDAEASLVKRSRSGGGSGVQLDLDAARVEVVQRLGSWAAAR